MTPSNMYALARALAGSLLGLAGIPVPAAAAPMAGPDPDTVIAFVHVAVVPMDRARVLGDRTVLVRGGHIVALGPATKIVVPRGAIAIDGRGKYLIPGLADMHVHLLPRVERDTAKTADLLFPYLANGITTVRDMHSGGRTPRFGVMAPRTDSGGLALKRQLARGEVLGPHLYTAGDPDISSPEAAAQSVAELKADGHDFVKISFDARWPGPKPIYDSILAVARRVHLPVVGHVPQGFDVTQLGPPWVSAEHLYEYSEYVLGLNGIWSRTDGGMVMTMRPDIVDTAVWMKADYHLDPVRLRQLTQALTRAKIWTCPTFSLLLNMRAAIGDAWSKRHMPDTTTSPPTFAPVVAKRYLEFDMQIVKALQDAGAGLLLGTDVENPFAIHSELAALVEAGLTPYQALATGTRNVAEFLGTLDSAGTVAVGKRADLVLLSGNPLQNISYTAGPAGVMLGGRWFARAALETRLAALEEGTKTLKEQRQHAWRH